jgi:membrane-associated phospholipid phosphatase
MVVQFIVKGTSLKISFLYVLVMLFLLTGSASAREISNLSFSDEIVNGTKRLTGETTDLLSTPLQLENGNLFMTLGVAGAIGLTYAFDKQIQNKLTAHPTNSLNHAADAGSLIGDPYVHMGIAALVYGGAILADSAKWKEAGEMIGEALILADTASLIIKESSGRGRPSVTSSRSDFKPLSFKRDYDSLPSMHTSSSFALASVLAAMSDSIAMKAAYYGTAAFVGYSRVYKNKHWASDVLLGAVTGELCGRVVTSFHAGKSRLALTPQADEHGAGLALVGTW